MKIATSLALLSVSSATGFVLFLPMILNGGEMRVYEYNPIILWGEFLTCMACTVLGISGIVRKSR